MINPPPEKLHRLMQSIQSRWRQPERHLVESSDVALLRGIWIVSHNEVLALQNDYDDARRAVAAVEERLPVVRDIAFWVKDPAAGIPFSMFAETLQTTTEELAAQLFQGVCRELSAIVSNKSPLTCPLCERKK